MRNFDDVETSTSFQMPQVRERVSVRSRKPDQSYVARSTWTWQDLRDYVITQMELRSDSGRIARDPLKESGIFKGFLARWGGQAPAIARYAFEERDGVWMGEPVTVSRFTKGADPYFATPIAEQLTDTQVAGW